jgi:hypothetical protein
MRFSLLTLLPAALATPLKHSTDNYHQELRTPHPFTPRNEAERLLAKEATVTKTFKFKDDFFLRISPLSSGFSPREETDQLLAALETYGEEFRDAWVGALMAELPDECAVEVRSN